MPKHFKPVFFRPFMDWWVGGLLLVFLSILAAGIPMIIWYGNISPAFTGLAVAGIIASLLYFVDLGFYSYYVLEENELIVTSHLRQFSFPYRAMRELRPGGLGALVSMGRRKRFALSRKNVIIKLQDGPWHTISVSPKEKDYFISQILDRIDHERSSRTTRFRQRQNG